MTGVRLDHVGVTVADLQAVTAFFVDLGLEVEGSTSLEGDFLDTVCGLEGARTDIVLLRPPGGGAALELARFVHPQHEPGLSDAPHQALGLRNVTFEVSDLAGHLQRMSASGFHPVGGVAEHEGAWRMASVRGPEGLLVNLAERLPGAATGEPSEEAEGAETARRRAHTAVLRGVADGDELGRIVAAVEACRLRGAYCPDVAMLEVVAAALDAGGVRPSAQVSSEDWQRAYVPELRRGSPEAGQASQMLHVALAFKAGLVVDVLEHTHHWHGDHLRAATAAAVMTVRALAVGRDAAAFADEVARRVPDFHTASSMP